MFRPGSNSRINALTRAMRLAVVSESARKNSTSEFMLELVRPKITQ